MKREGRRYGTTAIVVSVLVSGWLALMACSDQKEGDRCEVKNNSDDCAAGLVCTPSTALAPTFGGADRCCPQDRRQATHPACQTSSSTEDSAPPADTGPPPPDTGAPDANEAGPDAGDAEAGDAASDAPADG